MTKSGDKGKTLSKVECTVEVPAKINISLYVTGKRPDGYHLLETVMQAVDIKDYVTTTIKYQDGNGLHVDIKTQPHDPGIPLDESNTAYKACKEFYTDFDKKFRTKTGRRIEILIEKNIPAQAGLAGGSADGAGVLTALNHLYKNPFEIEQLLQIGAKVGADVPFCLVGKNCLCKGIGDIIRPLEIDFKKHVLLIKPPFGISTKEIFGIIDKEKDYKTLDHGVLIEAMERGDLKKIGSLAENALEKAASHKYPLIKDIKKMLEKLDVPFVAMTGSGSCVFGMFDSYDRAKKVHDEIFPEMEYNNCEIFLTETISQGPVISNRGGADEESRQR